MSFDVTESAEFRLHIRHLLYNYSITHLTTDYLTFTENLVSEFIEYLQPIPLTDPCSLVLSVDPFQSFSQLHALPSLKPYDEAPKTTNEALAYIKKMTGAILGKPVTEKIVRNDHYYKSPPIEPFLPALTRRALRSTIKLGKNTKKPFSSTEYTELLKAQKIDAIPVEPVQDDILSPEDILKLKYQIQPDELQAVRTLLQTTADMLRPQKSYKNKYLDPEFLRNIPFSEPTLPDDSFMPIFPKARLPRSGGVNVAGHLPDLKGFSDIPKAVLNEVEVEDPDGDISRQNLVIVDGWETIQSSPPSPPISSLDDDEDQLDQLFIPSSPDTEVPLVEELSNSKLEPILIPRTRQIGGSSGSTPHMLAGKTLATFLQPLLLTPKVVSVSIPHPEKNANEKDQRSYSSPTPSSLIGQPPSEMESGLAAMIGNKIDLQDQDLDSELKVLYAEHGLEDMIMKEVLDDKREMLMDVPSLPAPNIHPPNDLHVPRTFSDFLIQPTNAAESKDSVKKAVQPIQRFLKKTKGRESLALSLSWIPFTVDKKLPSAVELIGVSELFNEVELASEINQPKMEALLQSLDLSDNYDMDKRWRDFDTSGFQHSAAPLEFEILRTRQERWRLARLENRLEDGMDCEDVELRENSPDGLPGEKQESEKANSGIHSYPDDGQDVERPTKRARLEVDDLMGSQDSLLPFITDADMITEQNWQRPASPAFFASDDKENWPLGFSPSLSNERQQDADSADYYLESLDNGAETWALPQTFPDYSQILQIEDEENFEPLSFGSRQPTSIRSTFDAESYRPLSQYVHTDLETDHPENPFDLPMEVSVNSLDSGIKTNNSVTDDVDDIGTLALAFEPSIASHSLGIATFAQLRARPVNVSKPLPVSEPIAAPPIDLPHGQQETPQDIFDRETLRLPNVAVTATSVHRYLASVDLIQKHALVCALRSDECAVDLVERQTLDDVDLILDPHCAIIFLSLFVLPRRSESYLSRVSQQSWKFSRILVIFEAYPEQQATRSRKNSHQQPTTSELYAYTTPIVKAIKKFRRDVNIAEGCGTKCAGTKVEYAFANTVKQAALFTRMYGDLAEERDETQGMIWGEREWLASDFSEDEERLAGLNGLNRFSASIILCQISLQDFVDMTSQERADGFAGYIGIEPMNACNVDLDARLEVMYASAEVEESELGE